ncbi:MAG: 6,7-dimethyl-8-ribityllumazine synthase [Mucinivorans sp.]
MSTALKNLSTFDTPLPSAHDMVVGVVVSQWNSNVTSRLLKGAVDTLLMAGCPEENIVVKSVPGAYELPFAAQLLAENTAVDGVIVLGCVIRGGTPHFDYVCSGTTHGVMNVQLSAGLPVAFGLLTVDDLQQAMDRAGGELGNKGDEAASTVIRMIELQREMEVDTDDQGILDLMSNVANEGQLS